MPRSLGLACSFLNASCLHTALLLVLAPSTGLLCTKHMIHRNTQIS